MKIKGDMMRGFHPSHGNRQGYADGGVIDGVKRMFGFAPDPQRQAMLDAYRADKARQAAQQVAQTQQPQPQATQGGAISGYAGMDAMKRREREAGLYADGGMVRGPGTGTSDDVEEEAYEGTYIMPTDSTEQIGHENLARMGSRGFRPGGKKVPVALSNGEYKIPPEQVHAIGVQALDLMKNATHTPVARGFHPAGEKRMFLADGGAVTKDDVDKAYQKWQDAKTPWYLPTPQSDPSAGAEKAYNDTLSSYQKSAGTSSALSSATSSSGVNPSSGTASYATTGSDATMPAQDYVARGFRPSSPAASPAAPTSAVSQAPSNNVTRVGNSYSGTNIGAGFTINGKDPGGNYVETQGAGRGFQPAVQSLGLQTQQTPQVQSPQALNSSNSWEARNNLRNAEVSASSMTNQPGYGGLFTRKGIVGGLRDNPAMPAYQAAVQADLASRNAQPGLDVQTNNTNANLAQAAMRESGANARAALTGGLEQQRLGIDSQRAASEIAARGVTTAGAQQIQDLRSVLTSPTATEQQRQAAQSAMMAIEGRQPQSDWAVQVTPTTKNMDGSTSEGSIVRYNKRTGQVERVGQSGTATVPIEQNAQAIAIKNNQAMTYEQKAQALRQLGYL